MPIDSRGRLTTSLIDESGRIVVGVINERGALVVSGSGSTPQPVIDTFNRADTFSGLGNTDTGQPWIIVRGNFGIYGNEAFAYSTNSMAVVETLASDGTVSLTPTFIVFNDTASLVFRYTDSLNYWFLGIDASSYMKLVKVVNGTWNTIFNLESGFINGDKVSVTLLGADIGITINDVNWTSYNDSFNATGTKYGMMALYDSTTVDNFSMVPYVESDGGTVYQGSSTIQGVSSVSVSSSLIQSASTTIQGVGGLTATPKLVISSSASIQGVGGVVAASVLTYKATSTIQGVASLIAVWGGVQLGSANIQGVASVSAAGQLIKSANTTIQGVSSLVAASVLTYYGGAVIDGIGGLTANSKTIYKASVSITGIGSLNVLTGKAILHRISIMGEQRVIPREAISGSAPNRIVIDGTPNPPTKRVSIGGEV